MISTVEEKIFPYQQKLLQHSLYKKINTPEHLKTFMEYHVFAVWDFMSLLKALQTSLTCTTLPWTPKRNPETRYLINEIVLAEETDINRYGKRQSHFEMYLDAMHKASANTHTIENLLEQLDNGKEIFETIDTLALDNSIKEFLQFTFRVIEEGKPHTIAAAFTFGRENLIPSMFTEIIKNIQQHFPEEDLTDFKYYFDRHIELDEDEHGPMALQMISELCGDATEKWEEVINVSIEALQKREALWNGIEKNIMQVEFA